MLTAKTRENAIKQDRKWREREAGMGELHVPYSWCLKDQCACYWPECREHGCMDAREASNV